MLAFRAIGSLGSLGTPMHTSVCLHDLHERTHRSLRGLLDHCDGFSCEQLREEMAGFGYPTILLQLHHAIGAERYWIGVLEGQMLVDEDEADHASIGTLCAFRERVAGATAAYLHLADEDELNGRREMTTWGDKQAELVPAHVVIRTQTHIFQHQGQIAAMASLLGRSIPQGLDFPLA